MSPMLNPLHTNSLRVIQVYVSSFYFQIISGKRVEKPRANSAERRGGTQQEDSE